MGGLAFDRPDLLAGRYLLGDVIGRGGMGVVQRAWDTHLDRYVAVKLLRDLAMDPANRARFSAEGKTLAALNHPGLITLFDAATEGDEPYLVMELVEGPSLKERCNGVGMTVGEVAAIGIPLADALAYVHGQHIVHRDLKPSNVLFSADGRVKLADFGVARLIDGVTQDTASGFTIGTAAYLSPEQVREEPVTTASDIYSLGLVLMEALSGAPVFIGHPSVIVLARLTRPPTVNESLPAPLRVLLGAMTAVQPRGRPTAAEVAGELSRLLPTFESSPVTQAASGAPTMVLLTEAPTAPIPVSAPVSGPVSEPASAPLLTPARSRRPVGRVSVGVVAVVVLVGALLFGPLRNGASDAADGQDGTSTGQGGTVPFEPSLPVVPDPGKAAKEAKEEGKQALTDTGDKLKKEAQEKIKQAEDAATEAAKKAAKEAGQKAGEALDDALNALKDAVLPDSKSKG